MVVWVLNRIMNPEVTDYDTSLNTTYVLDTHNKQTFKIGRGRACDILLTSLFVSRYHCDIRFLGPDSSPHICDQKSENGTYVDGHKMLTGHTKELEAGSLIGVGVDTNVDKSCFVFELVKSGGVRPPVFPPLAPQEQVRLTPQEQMRSTPEERMRSTPEERMRSTPEEQIRSTPQEQMRSTPEEQIRSTPEEQMRSTPLEQTQPPVVNGGQPSCPAPTIAPEASGRNISTIILDSDCDSEGEDVVILTPYPKSPVDVPTKTLVVVESDADSDDCMIVDDIPSAGVSSGALISTVFEVTTEETSCVDDGLRVIAPAVSVETCRENSLIKCESNKNLKPSISPESSRHSNNTSGGDHDDKPNVKSNVPVETIQDSELVGDGVKLKVEPTVTNATTVCNEWKVDRNITAPAKNNSSRDIFFEPPTVNIYSSIKLDPDKKSNMPLLPVEKIQDSGVLKSDIKFKVEPTISNTTEVRQRLKIDQHILEPMKDVNSSRGVAFEPTVVALKDVSSIKPCLLNPETSDEKSANNVQREFNAIKDQGNDDARVESAGSASAQTPVSEDASSASACCRADDVDVKLEPFSFADASADYTNWDTDVILIDDDEEAEFPCSQQSSFRGGEGTPCVREGEGEEEREEEREDSADEDDDDDSVDLWYGRLSQQSAVQRRLESVSDAETGRSPGYSKGSGLSLDVDLEPGSGSAKRKSELTEVGSGESSSGEEDLFLPRPKRFRKAIISTSDDEEEPLAGHRLSEPLPAARRKLSMNKDARSRSVDQRPASESKPSSATKKSSDPVPRRRIKRPCPTSVSESSSDTDVAPTRKSSNRCPASVSKSPSGSDSDTDLNARSSASRKKRLKLSPVSLAAKLTNHELEQNLTRSDDEFPVESSDYPNKYKEMSDSDDNISVTSNQESRLQASGHTSDSEQEELLELVGREVKTLDKSWLRKKDDKKPKLIEALPMPQRRSHQRGISGNEAVRLFEKNNMGKNNSESHKKESKKETIKEHRPKPAEKTSTLTKGTTRRVSPRKRGQNTSIAKRNASNLNQNTSTAADKEQQKIDKRRKLKEIAVKEKADAEEKAKASMALALKKVLSKPIIKITDKSRTILLAQDLTSSSNRAPPPQAKQKPRPPQPQALYPQTVTQDKQIPICHRPITQIGTSSPNANTVLRDERRPVLPQQLSSTLQSVPKLKFPKIPLLKDRPKQPSATNTTDCAKLPSTSSRTSTEHAPMIDNQLRPLATITNTLARKSCLVDVSTVSVFKPKVKKYVRFIMEPFVKYFKSDNLLRKSVGNNKDVATPILPRSLTPVQKSLYDSLNFILGWNNKWFQEQRAHNADRVPSVHGNMQRIQMLSRFTSYSDYWKVMNPLMLLNLWACITKDNDECVEEVLYPFAIDDQMQCKEDPALCRVNCHTLLNAHMKAKLPSAGYLVVLELNGPKPTNADSQSTQVAVKYAFGYVERTHKDRLRDNSIIHERLASRIADPREVLRLVLIIKMRNQTLGRERPSRLKVCSYIRPALRTFQAVAALSYSPLRDRILMPHVKSFTLPNQLQHDGLGDLKDQLNKAQYAAVCRTAEVCLSDEPKICMIQGPPGTGKSFVIVHLIQAVLKCTRMRKPPDHYRVLVCAPSNASLGELVRRLIAVRNSMPEEEQFKLVRTGQMHPDMDPVVKTVCLEELVNVDIKAQAKKENENASLESIQLEINGLRAKIHAIKLQMEAAKGNKMDNCKKLATYSQRLERLETSSRTSNSTGHHHWLRRETEQKILRNANVIACTLTSCTSSAMEPAFMNEENSFGCCIIDEASQCCEPENLLPLLLGIKILVLVGDPMQLPAVTISKVAKDYGFGTSLFARLGDCFADVDPSPVQFLHEQYRMHPNIVRWPNLRFYSNRLVTPAQIKDKRHSSLVPYLILKHDCLQDNDMLANQGEAELVATLVNCIKDCKSTRHLSIGIITPYKEQRHALVRTLRRADVTVSTIDGFQGQERDVVIMSCVRTDGTGFMSDEQRLNVALTRAKYCMVLCANFQSLNGNSTWRNLHDDAIQRNTLKNISSANFRNSQLITKMLIR